MSLIRTVCPRDCPDTCFMDVEVDGDRIVSTRGSTENPVTAGFLCARGRADAQRVSSPSRLRHPLARDPQSGVLERVSWDLALDRITGQLRETLERHGPDRVLLLDYAGNTGLLAAILPRRLWNVLGAARTDHGICTRSGHAGLELHYGSSLGLDVEDLPLKRIIIFWGHNGLVSSPHLYRLAVQARRSGAILVCVDPRRSETALQADLHLATRPGTDVALAWGIVRALIERDAVDLGFVERSCLGYEPLRARALSLEPAWIQETTGVAWKEIQELARILHERHPSAWMLGIGYQKQRQGGDAVRAVSLLPALLGEQRGFYYTNSRGRLVDFGALSGDTTLAGAVRIVPQVAVGELLERGEFNFVHVFCMNPAATLPGADAVRRGLARKDVFVVVHDTHQNQTTALADVVLPATTFLEKDDLVVSDSHTRVRKACRAIPPVGESLGEVELMVALGRRLGLQHPALYQDPWEALREATRGAFQEGSFDGLLRGESARWAEAPRDRWPTPSGRIELQATGFPEPAVEFGEGGRFTLLMSAPPRTTNSQYQDIYGPISDDVWIAPGDAEGLGVRDGERVILENELAGIEATARVTERTQVGVLWMARPVEDRAGRPQNALVSQDAQVLGGGAVYNSTRVTVRGGHGDTEGTDKSA